MRTYTKRDFPVHRARELLEPGPIVLVSSQHKNEMNIMAMGWHTILEFSPSLIGCMITRTNHSFDLIRKSRECVINLPTSDMAKTVIGIGNCSGTDTDKFAAFNLTAAKARMVKAPVIKECYAHFECKIHDTKLINSYNFFIFEIVKAQKATSPQWPSTLHYRGHGDFMVSGKPLNVPSQI